MIQTRTLLVFAWLIVATLLWMEWGKEHVAPPTPEAATATASQGAEDVPAADSALPSAPAVPATSAAPPPPPATGAASAGQAAATVTVATDVLRLTLDGGTISGAELPRYPRDDTPGSPPVQLFDTAPADYFVAQSGWVSSASAAPSHEHGFVPEQPQRSYTLAPGSARVSVPFVWNGPGGVTIRRTYTLRRGDYAVEVRDEVVNAGNAPWQGYVYRQLMRTPQVVAKHGFGLGNPAQYSFQGAAWYSPQDRYEKRKYKDFADGPLDKEHPQGKEVAGGWIAILQHHFFAAWIPASGDKAAFSLAQVPAGGGERYLVRELGPAVSVAPGQRAATEARLWIGPKLVAQIEAQRVPGLERAVDFSSYTTMATLAGWLFWVLEKLHRLFGNWGWAIIGLVVIIKALMYPLSAAQYKSMAKMRKFQPRIEQLKERYGEDKQKFQMAMMELYKKEKINPAGGCLPVLVQMPVFLALYWMLSESVELRHAPWVLWIHDLTARDPYFILPVINAAVMLATQKLSPSPGMDPMQKKMMQFMPVVFGVMFAFFPAGLVLYWVTNGTLGLLQQWWMTRVHGAANAKA